MESQQERMTKMEEKISLLERRIGWLLVLGVCNVIFSVAKLYLASQGHGGNTNSVQIGSQAAASPQRDFLNTDEVGQREGVTARTVLSWIEAGRIDPPPTRNGRAWEVSADYRILPQLTADSR